MTRSLGALLLVVLCSSTAAAQTPQGSSEPVVVTSGEGLVKAAPDQAWVRLATESRSKNPKEAQAQNAKAMAAVQQALVAAGIPKDAIRTLSFHLQFESDWVNGRQVPRGYVARNLIEVTVDDVSRVGEVIDLAVTNGANSVQNVRFDVKNREALERDALRRATTDARQRADAMAAGAGRSIDRVIRIEEPVRHAMPVRMEMAARAPMTADRVETPIVPGEIEIRATVVLTATMK